MVIKNGLIFFLFPYLCTYSIYLYREMARQLLYKYLDAQGAELMLDNGNLQFTNATKFNDPFDCHPELIGFSHISPERAPWGMKDTKSLEAYPYERNREEAWICCLSKIPDSLRMWAFYTNNHEGVCIGLDVEKLKPHIHPGLGLDVTGDFLEVEYRDIIKKPDHFKGEGSYYYQMVTKAKEWEYEQEVRIIIFKPMPWFMDMLPPPKLQGDDEIDEKERRAYPTIGGDCFAAIYLGKNILPRHKQRIIEIARKRNPDIKIYQMKTDPDALRLVPLEIV
jgi:hypothetical protein